MNSQLTFTKEDGKIVLYDKNVYETEEDLKTLYTTFKKILESNKEKRELDKQRYIEFGKTLEQQDEEIVIMENRFKQIQEFFEAEGITPPEE